MVIGTVRDGLLEISLQKSSAGFEPNFTCEIRNWLAGAQDLNFYLLSQSGLCAAGENFALSGVAPAPIGAQENFRPCGNLV